MDYVHVGEAVVSARLKYFNRSFRNVEKVPLF